jgi:hypothetical protein
VVIIDRAIRIAQTLPTPTSASAATTTCAGRMNAVALPTKPASAHVVGRARRTAREYSASRTVTAARTYDVFPKIRPTVLELKNGPGISGTGARIRHARNANRYARRDEVPAIRRTTVPVMAALRGARPGARRSSGRRGARPRGP